MPTLVGSKLDKYEMLEEVGHGGMAVVYRAYDTVLHREVAVKVLHPHLADREESRLRLQREAIAVAKLRHDHILEIYDYSGPRAPECFIVTEFIHGPTLREWMDEDDAPRPAIAALLIHRLGLALAHAHRSGVVHRDIKPENVMIRTADGCLKLMDFGIAQLLDNQKLTMTGQLIGSPAYMAPELVSGRALDARTDIFSLGIMLYQLATGELPFRGRNAHEVLNRIADGDYPAPSTVSALVDRELEAIIATALATAPSERFQSVEDLTHELQVYLEDVGIEPTQAELVAYFADRRRYTEELDERVCKALMRSAELAARNAKTSLAIRYLGRVLELQAHHPEAKAMLGRLRNQERRMRQGLLAAGLVAASGLVAAGFLLIPAQRPKLMPTIAAAAAPLARDAPPIQGPAKLGLALPRREPAPDTRPRPADGPTAQPDARDVAVAGPAGPEPAPAPRPEPVGRATRDLSAKEPPRRHPPERYPCILRITKVPRSWAQNAKLTLGRDAAPITIKEPDRIEVEVEGWHKVQAVVLSDRLTGHAWLSPEACDGGGVVEIVGQKRDAQIKFTGAPKNTSVQCLAGCPSGVSEFMADNPPSIPIAKNKTERLVRLRLKASCHEQPEISTRLSPGPNEVIVKLNPLAGCE